MARRAIHAAGGVVVRDGTRPRLAVVQRKKDKLWVLPRGKLKRDERAVNGARREVTEETGHRVIVGEFLGAIAYRVRGRSKVVQFWYMRAAAYPSCEVMKDIIAVEWLPLVVAIRRLSYPLEKLFLSNIGRRAVLPRKPHPPRKPRARNGKTKRSHLASRRRANRAKPAAL